MNNSIRSDEKQTIIFKKDGSKQIVEHKSLTEQSQQIIVRNRNLNYKTNLE